MRAVGARGRVRPHQPGPDLRHAGGERRRLAAVAGRGDRRRARSRLRLRPDRRGRHPAGRQGAPRRDRRARRRRAGRPVPDRRRPARAGGLHLVRDLELGDNHRRAMPAQPAVLDRRRLVGVRPRRAQPRRRHPLVERAAPGGLRGAAGGGRVSGRGSRGADPSRAANGRHHAPRPARRGPAADRPHHCCFPLFGTCGRYSPRRPVRFRGRQARADPAGPAARGRRDPRPDVIGRVSSRPRPESAGSRPGWRRSRPVPGTSP